MIDSHFERATKALARAKLNAGGGHALAREMTRRGWAISSQAIQKWKVVPSARVLQVEKITGISRHDLRRDFYPKS